jgi:hypothetical protein
LFLGDLGWRDTARLGRERRTVGLYDQLYRAAGTILRVGPRLRQGKPGLILARHVLGEAVFQHRLQLLTRVVQLLLTTIPQQPTRVLREQPETYQSAPEHGKALNALLQNVPFPDLDDT